MRLSTGSEALRGADLLTVSGQPCCWGLPQSGGSRTGHSFSGPVQWRWSPGPLRGAWSPVDTRGCPGWVRGCVVWLPRGRCSPLHRTFLCSLSLELSGDSAAACWLAPWAPPPRPLWSRNTDQRRGKGCGDAQTSSLREFWNSLLLDG